MDASSLAPAAYRRSFGERPPPPMMCSCPWHCPVNWESYDPMMHNWAKGGPPPTMPPHDPTSPYPVAGPGFWPPHTSPHFQELAVPGTLEKKSALGKTVEVPVGVMQETKQESESTTSSLEELQTNVNEPGSRHSVPRSEKEVRSQCDFVSAFCVLIGWTTKSSVTLSWFLKQFLSSRKRRRKSRDGSISHDAVGNCKPTWEPDDHCGRRVASRSLPCRARGT